MNLLDVVIIAFFAWLLLSTFVVYMITLLNRKEMKKFNELIKNEWVRRPLTVLIFPTRLLVSFIKAMRESFIDVNNQW